MIWAKSVDDDVIIIRISGSISCGHDISEIQDSVCRDLERGFQRFVVDFADSKLLKSPRMGLFLGMLAATRCRGAEIVLSRTDGVSEDCRCLCRLLKLFQSFQDRQGAVAAFGHAN